MKVEYKILSDFSAKKLEEQVVDLMENDRFIPQGGVAVTRFITGTTESALVGGGTIATGETLFTQAMVKVQA